MIADLKRVKIKIRKTKEREKRLKFHRPVAVVSVCRAPGRDKTDTLSFGFRIQSDHRSALSGSATI